MLIRGYSCGAICILSAVLWCKPNIVHKGCPIRGTISSLPNDIAVLISSSSSCHKQCSSSRNKQFFRSKHSLSENRTQIQLKVDLAKKFRAKENSGKKIMLPTLVQILIPFHNNPHFSLL